MSKESQTSGKRPRRSFTEEFKRDAVNLVAVEGYSFNRAALAVGVSSNSLRRWYEKFIPEPEACGEDATFGQLQDENKRLRKKLREAEMEREILKKATAFFAKESRCPFSNKQGAWINQHRDSFLVIVMCRVLGVSRSGFYKWLKAAPSPRARRSERIRAAVREIHEQSYQIYGSYKIAEVMQANDKMETACRNTVAAAMREFGSEGTSFDTIVAAGPNGAMAHHRPSDTSIRRGEPIVIDMGAQVGGYCSDITRTVVVGEPDETFRKIYDIVLGAQLTAISTVRVGMTGEECDGLSRTVISEAGYGDNFGHSLGHGVGLEVHENPRVGPKAANTLESGMVFTVEPGIYLSGWGGVRIEDIVILGEDGAKPLSKASK